MLCGMEEKKRDNHERNVDDLIEIVVSIKDNMVTKTEFTELDKKVDEGFAKTEQRFKNIDHQFEGTNGKIEGLHRRIDAELEQRKLLEDRVSKVEAEAFPV